VCELKFISVLWVVVAETFLVCGRLLDGSKSDRSGEAFPLVVYAFEVGIFKRLVDCGVTLRLIALRETQLDQLVN
jgi:hypothetical protein